MAKLFMAHCKLDGCSGHEAGRKLLRQLFDTCVGGEMPQIAVTPQGKPYFLTGNWHFSISHTKKHAFCALADRPIGIDAEEMDRKIDLRLAQKILSPVERAQFDAAPDQRQALLRLWVLKEAAAKLTGKGLRGYPNHTEFDLHDSRVTTVDGCYVAMLQEETYAV